MSGRREGEREAHVWCIGLASLPLPAYAQGTSLLLLLEDQSNSVRAGFLFLSGSSNEKLVCCRISAATSGNSSVVPKHVTGSFSADAICVNEMPCLRMPTGNKRRCGEMTLLMSQSKDQIQEKVIIFPNFFLIGKLAHQLTGCK